MDIVWLIFYVGSECTEFLGIYTNPESAKKEVERLFSMDYPDAYWRAGNEEMGILVYELYGDVDYDAPYVTVEPWVPRQ